MVRLHRMKYYNILYGIVREYFIDLFIYISENLSYFIACLILVYVFVILFLAHSSLY